MTLYGITQIPQYYNEYDRVRKDGTDVSFLLALLYFTVHPYNRFFLLLIDFYTQAHTKPNGICPIGITKSVWYFQFCPAH